MPGPPDTGKRIMSIQRHKSHFWRDTDEDGPSSAKPKTTGPIGKPAASITVEGIWKLCLKRFMERSIYMKNIYRA